MERITYKGVEGVFYPQEEMVQLQTKILAQNELIGQLKEKVGLIEGSK